MYEYSSDRNNTEEFSHTEVQAPAAQEWREQATLYKAATEGFSGKFTEKEINHMLQGLGMTLEQFNTIQMYFFKATPLLTPELDAAINSIIMTERSGLAEKPMNPYAQELLYTMVAKAVAGSHNLEVAELTRTIQNIVENYKGSSVADVLRNIYNKGFPEIRDTYQASSDKTETTLQA